MRVPRFFIHLHDDYDVEDSEGVELSSAEAARARATADALEVMCEVLKTQGRVVLHHRIDIEDEQGAVLDTVMFRDVVTIEA